MVTKLLKTTKNLKEQCEIIQVFLELTFKK